MKRREFLAGSAAVLGATAAPRVAADDAATPQAQRPQRVLMLGGTNYVGPHLVRAAIEAGHEVTLFNRGFTNPTLFPHLEQLRGNRYRGLAALEGKREFDVVYDTWDREPGCVDDTARLLAERTRRYVYISSIAVYGGYRDAGLDETSPTVDGADHRRSFDPELAYPEAKRAAELSVLERFGERGTVLRCSTIQGYNANASVLPYWGLRFMSGEPVLVPDDDTAVLQWTDARDVGRFALHCAAHELGGIYNLINPREPARISAFFDAWHAATGRRSRIVRAPRDFLARHNVQPWVDLPLYIPEDDPEPGFFRIDARRAHASGFRFRPLGETVADIVHSFPHAPAPDVVPNALDRRRELELIWQLESGTVRAT